jgi:hypothetical protein
MFKPVGFFFLLPVVLLTQDTIPPVIPPENNHHWQKLDKVCESGRKTYGANEFVENGKVCRWLLVPYWPADRKK